MRNCPFMAKNHFDYVNYPYISGYYHFIWPFHPVWPKGSNFQGPWEIVRLNSGIFRILELSELNLNLNSLDCKASKIISNDTPLEPISWELNVGNQCFNFCVGVGVGGQDATNFSHISKDAQENSTSFDTNCMSAAGRGKKLWSKNCPKNGFYGG